MLNKVIEFVGKWSGLSALWKFTDGYKAKGTAIVAMLTGLAGLISQFIGLPHDLGAYSAFFLGLLTNPNYIGLLGGAYGLGIAHKMDKTTAPVAPDAAKAPDSQVGTTMRAVVTILFVIGLMNLSAMVFAADIKSKPVVSKVTVAKVQTVQKQATKVTPVKQTKTVTVTTTTVKTVTAKKLAEKDFVPHKKRSSIPDRDKRLKK